MFTVHIAGTHGGTSQRAAALVALSARDVGMNGLSQNFNWGRVDQTARDYPWACKTFIGRALAGRRGHRQHVWARLRDAGRARARKLRSV